MEARGGGRRVLAAPAEERVVSDRLTEIRARFEAATPGDWPRWFEVYRASRWFDGVLAPPYSSFYACAPADVRWLLDEVERLRLLVPCENCGEQGDSDECAYCGAAAGAA